MEERETTLAEFPEQSGSGRPANQRKVTGFREKYLRPVTVGVAFCIVGELLIFVVWGRWRYPQGSLLHKFLWTVLLCGPGMGVASGTVVGLLVVGKYYGIKAILATTAVWVVC